jgi:hypothetical protein
VAKAKVHVGQANTALLVCPHCGSSKTVDVKKYRDSKGPLKVRCTCDSTFEVLLEFRQTHRKETHLPGYYCKLPRRGRWEEMAVDNISFSGLGFLTLEPPHVKVGDTVRVKFRLDDKKRSPIEKEVEVREVKDTHVGCSFTRALEFGQVDSALGFYLMP